MRDDGAGPIVELAELIAGGDVLDGGGLVFAGKEVVTPGMVETFADVLEGIGEGPADADRFFRETQRRVVENPAELVGEEKGRDVLVAVDRGGREDYHKNFGFVSVVCCQLVLRIGN